MTRNRINTSSRSYIKKQKQYDAHRQEVRRKNLEYRRIQQLRKAERTRQRFKKMRNAAHIANISSIRDNRKPADTKATNIRRKRKSRFNIGISYPLPVRYAIALFSPCKRAKSAERHNVFRRINRYGKGSIAKRTINRIRCKD